MTPDHPEPDATISPSPADSALVPCAPPAWQRLPLSLRRALLTSGLTAGVVGLFHSALPGGPPQQSAARLPKAGKPAPVAKLAVARTGPASVREERALLIESIVRSQKKRIMGRKRSLADVARVATLVGPLVARALDQPSIQADLRALAEQNGMSLAEYKRYFRRKQEADILLESGGDPNARSVSNAIGVAQFLAGTARASGGLKVDLPDSRRLTGRIAHAQAEIAVLEELPADWTKPLPGARPSAVESHVTLMAAAPSKEPGSRAAGDPSPRAPLTSRGAHPDRASAAEAMPPAVSTALDPANQPSAGPPSGTAASAPNNSPSAPPSEPSTVPAAAPTTVGTGDKPAPAEEGTSMGATAAAPPEKPAPAPEPKPAVCPAPGSSSAAPVVVTRDALIAKRARELRLLESKRRQVDERYDPAKAIASQTRYLVRMARRYGSLDWVFQAYHGGEGGVRNTVAYYLGDRWKQFGSPEGAIRGVLASRGGIERVREPLSFEDLYFKTTPVTEPAAFSYLYGRSDNHRYYWWKILAAERAIDLYRRDPGKFREQWQALRPGQRLEVVWYPRSKELNFHDVAALKQGYAAGQLVHWPAGARSHGLVLDNIAPLDPANAYQYKGLRPEALGALFRIADLYLNSGGSSMPLRVVSLVQTEQYRAELNARHPPSWMRRPTKPEEIPIDLEPTGLCFDIQRPTAAWNRKVLEYALGWLADRNQIYWVEEWEQGPPRYHICPSPDYRRELVRASR
jgi:soluble lytic murein transglycosylase-like protein